MTLSSLFRRFTSGPIAKTDTPPIDPRTPAEARLKALRVQVQTSRASYMNAVLDAVAYDLETRELFGGVMYWSTERVGLPLREVLNVIDDALLHANGSMRIEGLDYPFNEPQLARTLGGVRAMFAETTLDVSDSIIPRYDARTNLRLGALVTQGVDPIAARQQAHDETMRMQAVVASGRAQVISSDQERASGVTVIRPEWRNVAAPGKDQSQPPSRVPDGLTPVASHTPTGHKGLTR